MKGEASLGSLARALYDESCRNTLDARCWDKLDSFDRDYFLGLARRAAEHLDVQLQSEEPSVGSVAIDRDCVAWQSTLYAEGPRWLPVVDMSTCARTWQSMVDNVGPMTVVHEGVRQ